MDAERARTFLLGLPHVVETTQWGGVVFWVGDKAVGGKMFAMLNPEGGGERPMSYAAGAERFRELVERESMVPAAYLARAGWVSAELWGALRDGEWEHELRAAHGLTLAKMPAKGQAVLALPKGELKRVVVERRRLLAEREAAKGKSRG